MKSELDLNHWLEDHVGHEFFKNNYFDLEKIFKPQVSKIKLLKIKIITVAGTNGKGQTARLISQLLVKNQKNVALFLSPHHICPTERLRFNNQTIAQAKLHKIFEKNKACAPILGYFSFIFYCFCDWLLELKNLDYIVLEVGLGGRFDAVNLLDTDLGIITSISRDHTEILGPKLKDILWNKFGISRPGVPLITNLSSKYLREICCKWSQEQGVLWTDINELDEKISRCLFHHQNFVLAQETCKRLGHEHNYNNAQLFDGVIDCKYFLSSTHNLDGWRHFLKALEVWMEKTGQRPFSKLLISFSKRPVKEVGHCLELINDSKHLYQEASLVEFNHPKAMEKRILNRLATDYGIRFRSCFEDVIDDASNDSILFAGSNYFLGQVKSLLYSRDDLFQSSRSRP